MKLDGDHAAGAPRDAVRADRVHLRGGDVGDGRAPRRVAVRRGRLSGDGSRPPSELELALAEHHGKYMATLVKKMVHGAS